MAPAPPHAWTWGREGHEVIAEIADAHLTDTVRAQVRDLLSIENHTSMDEVASWADEIRTTAVGN
jgi:hypothetical protein